MMPSYLSQFKFFSHQTIDTSNLKWKKIEANKKKLVHKIDKIENFQGLGCPIVRFRSTIEGPCVGALMAEFVMNIDERAKWDPQIAQVDEVSQS